jgi:flagellar M-ring protein FliF
MATNFPIARILDGFSQLPARNRAGLMLAVAALGAVLAASWLWSRVPDYRVLYANLNERDGGAVVAALGQMNVPYKFNEGGNAILVPAENVHDARLRLASQGLPKGGGFGFELVENQKLGVTQFQEQVTYQRALEGELARSVQSVAAVQGARVHLAVPKQSSFLREQAKPSASVLVNLYPGKTLERAQIAGIVHLVASSVPELQPKNVSVIDQNGTLLSAASHDGSALALDPGQLAYALQIESSYIRRIEDILEPIVGRSNVRAQVAADIDFSATEATAETFKPNQGGAEATVRSTQSSESLTPNGAGAQGVPGAISNQPTSATAPAAPGSTAQAASTAGAATRKDQTTQFEVDRTVRRTSQPTGAIKRISAAVVVNHRKPASGNGKPAPLTEQEMAQITALVKDAIGFNQMRGDSLNVANAAFSAEPVGEAPAEVPFYLQSDNIAFAKEVGKTGLAAGLILYIVFGVLLPMLRQLATLPPPAPAVEGEVQSHVALDHAARLNAARALAKQDPKIVANVVKSWVAGNG